MSRKLAGLIVCGLFVVGCGQSPTKPMVPIAHTGASKPATVDGGNSAQFTLEDYVVQEPIRFENLAVFPVTSRTPKTDDRFITLDEGLKAGSIEIRELASNGGSMPSQGDPLADDPVQSDSATGDSEARNLMFGGGNEVNTLIVVNHSDKPLYLMPGEVIIGGSQDRTIGDELVIAPKSQPTKVPVFCVEHGRWGTKGVEQTIQQISNSNSTPALSDSVSLSVDQDGRLDRIAHDADGGKFVASVGQLGKSARLAVQSDKDQSAVWEKVAETNLKSGVSPDSGAFTANYTDVETVKRLEPYLEQLQTAVTKHDQVVGVLVAINGKIESIDVFESTPLFQKIWPKLLKSYSLDAMNAADDSTEQPVACTRAAALAFFAETLHANVASSDTEHGIGMVKRDGQHVLSFTSHISPAEAPASMGGGMGGMGGVHFSGFAK